MQKHKDILSQIRDLEVQLQTASEDVSKSLLQQDKATDDDEDAFDAFMMKLSTPVADRKLVTRIKMTFYSSLLQYAYSSLCKLGLCFDDKLRHYNIYSGIDMAQ